MMPRLAGVVGKRKITRKPREKRAVLYIPISWVTDENVVLLRFSDDTILVVPSRRVKDYITTVHPFYQEKEVISNES